MRFQRTFGPTIVGGDNEIVAVCITKGDDTIFGCMFRIGGHCTAAKPTRELPAGDNRAPDWCEYRASALDDARELDDFHILGLDAMTRPELLKLAKDLPDDHRPKPLSKATKYQLQRAIRADRLAAGQALSAAKPPAGRRALPETGR